MRGAWALRYLLTDRVANAGELTDAGRRRRGRASSPTRVAGVAAGGTALAPQVVTGRLNATRHAGTLPALTAREHDVLALLAEGRCSSATADQLVVTQATAG